MCDAIAIALTSAAVGAFGQLADAGSKSNAAKRDALRAEENAAEVKAFGAIRANDFRQDGEQAIGRQKAQTAAAGIDFGGESAIDQAFSSRQAVEYDVAKIGLDSDIDAGNYEFEAQTKRKNARDYLLQGVVGATTSFLGKPEIWKAIL